MKQLVLLFGIVASATAANGANQSHVQRATFTAPFVHPVDPIYRIDCGPTPFRWGWFGAAHYPPAPVMQRDYTGGWREWHYRR